jgi:hypothetical protein
MKEICDRWGSVDRIALTILIFLMVHRPTGPFFAQGIRE